MPSDDSRPPGHDQDDAAESADDVILSEETAAPGSRTSAPPTSLSPHDLATPYVLDALELDEREAFERHLATCDACQRRVAELEDAALLLPDALVSPPADLPDAFPFLLRDVAHETLPPMAGEYLDDEIDEPVGEASDEPPAIDPDAGLTPVDAEPETDPADSEPIDLTGESESIEVDEPTVDVAPEPKRGRGKKREKQVPPEITEEIVPQPAYPTRPSRPPGRIRPGVRPPAGSAAGVAGGTRGFQLTPPIVAALAVGVVALGLFLWALLLLGRVGDLEDEIDQQNQEITALRQQANATAWTLTATSSGPAGASGTFFFSLPDQQGALVVRGLDPVPNEWGYQIWFIDDDESTPVAGPVFQVDENGEALIPLSAELATFDAVAISMEPASGSPAPTSQLLIQGRLGGAAG